MPYEIPVSLNTPDFVDAWESWIEYRKEKKLPVTDRALKSQLRILDRTNNGDPSLAALAIDYSIANDWQGLFPVPAAVLRDFRKAPSGIPKTESQTLYALQTKLEAKEKRRRDLYSQYRFEYQEKRDQFPEIYEETRRLKKEIEDLRRQLAEA